MQRISRREVFRLGLAGAALTRGSVGASARGVSRLSCDVAVYGATPGGISAAIAAARLGRQVLLLAHEDHIGGIVSNGLTNADIGKRKAVGGLFYEFTHRVVRYYQASDRDNPARLNVKLCRDGPKQAQFWASCAASTGAFHPVLLTAFLVPHDALWKS